MRIETVGAIRSSVQVNGPGPTMDSGPFNLTHTTLSRPLLSIREGRGELSRVFYHAGFADDPSTIRISGGAGRDVPSRQSVVTLCYLACSMTRVSLITHTLISLG